MVNFMEGFIFSMERNGKEMKLRRPSDWNENQISAAKRAAKKYLVDNIIDAKHRVAPGMKLVVVQEYGKCGSGWYAYEYNERIYRPISDAKYRSMALITEHTETELHIDVEKIILNLGITVM